MEVRELIAFAFDCAPNVIGHAPIRVHIKQDRSSVANQTVRPACDDERADKTCERVLSAPSRLVL
jgi:hypothetical protein